MAKVVPQVSLQLPKYVPVEPKAVAAKRRNARKHAVALPIPTDKKYFSWERYGLADAISSLPLAGEAPQLTYEADDCGTGLKPIVIPLSQAIRDWPEHIGESLLGEALPPEDHLFSALSGALFRDGVVVVVPKGTKLSVNAVFPARSEALNVWRSLFIVGDSAELDVYDATSTVLGGEDDSIAVHGVEVYAHQGSRVSYTAKQSWPESVVNLAVYQAKLHRDASVDWMIGSFGAGKSQVHVESKLAGEGAMSNVRSIFFSSHQQHYDLTLEANHLAGHATSQTYARGVVSDNARAVYRGMIKIQPGAHGTSADQNGHAMLLADTAHADLIPGLEIDADDVTAGHGATVGQIDDETLFYMMSRGLSEDVARNLIVEGFFADLIRNVPKLTVRDAFLSEITSRLSSTMPGNQQQ